MGASLAAMAAAGVAGVAVELWWGVVERHSPGEYDWAGYLELAAMARRHGLRVRAILAFHQCGAGPHDPPWCVSPPLAFIISSASAPKKIPLFFSPHPFSSLLFSPLPLLGSTMHTLCIYASELNTSAKCKIHISVGLTSCTFKLASLEPNYREKGCISTSRLYNVI
jgi:hypothetical protein